MASTNLQRFQQRLALVDYFRWLFGVEDVHDAASVRAFYDILARQQAGYDAAGSSYVAKTLSGMVGSAGVVDESALLRYDANVRRHTQAINRLRTTPITLKYFQMLAALMTERYLDCVTHDPDGFLHRLDHWVKQQNEKRGGYISYPSFSLNDLNRLAFWMATGSGKTLLMHLHYYQYLDYSPVLPENVLLITPNEGLSQQHLAELEKSGIPARSFSASSADLYSVTPNTIKVIEITKLKDAKTGSGESMAVSSFEGRNLVFVDEGHKGASSEAQKWWGRREALAENGFTFEYSATFGQGVAGAGTDVEETYGKSILFDYAYPRFYDDGYGKDYRILNVEGQALADDLRDRYLLANLLVFYQQLRAYREDEDIFYQEYNVARPLLIFIGHTVTAGKTWSSLGQNDRRSLSDVQELTVFLHRVLRNENDWAPSAIDAILSGNAGLQRDEGDDLFADALRPLREMGLSCEVIYQDMLRRVFHVAAPSTLNLINLASAGGEIALRAGASDRYFGLINIGDDANFLRIMQEKAPQITVAEEQFSDSLFQRINERHSDINVLLGARKFIEGWDSWRVSSMGLLNIGQGEGPQIVQLFGRGVRLLGKDRSLKRSTALEGKHPTRLPLLETLHIFGVRASYMETFRDYLKEEGISTDPRDTVFIETQIDRRFRGKGLLVVRVRAEADFSNAVSLMLKMDPDAKPHLDLRLRQGAMVSPGLLRDEPIVYETPSPQVIPSEYLPLFDWQRIFQAVSDFRTERGYKNLALDHNVLRRVIEEEHYYLDCPKVMVQIQRFTDVARLEAIALMLLRRYIERFYKNARRRWEKTQLEYRPLEAELDAEAGDGVFIRRYEAQVQLSARDFLQKLHKMCEDDALYTTDSREPDAPNIPARVYFDRHLYLPLLEEYDESKPADEKLVKYSPPGLNTGEARFVRELRDYLRDDPAGQKLLEDWEVFLLRNLARGRGIGFLIGDHATQKYFPDFILWLQSETCQHIAFIDPHGLVHAGNLDNNPKVMFRVDIKEYEATLNKRAGRDDVRLHSFIISQTDIDDLQNLYGYLTKAELHRRHVYLRDDGPGEIIDRILSKEQQIERS